MKRALSVWAHSPPFSKVYITPHVAHSGAVYLADDHPLVKSGHLESGIHVSLEAHRDAIAHLESGGTLADLGYRSL